MAGLSTKEKVLEAIQQLPADATVEDAMERLYFLAKIERGLADAAAGRVVAHDEVCKRFALQPVDRIVRTDEAVSDLDAIRDFIAQHSPQECYPGWPM